MMAERNVVENAEENRKNRKKEREVPTHRTSALRTLNIKLNETDIFQFTFVTAICKGVTRGMGIKRQVRGSAGRTV